jgi:hypothetical protein
MTHLHRISGTLLNIILTFILVGSLGIASLEMPAAPRALAATATVEIASTAFNVGTNIDVNLSIKGITAPGLKSYDVTITFDKTKVTVNSVGGGDAPFGAPATATIDNVAGTVRIANAITAGFPTGDKIVAKVNLHGVATGTSNLTVTINSLKDGADADITPTITNGTATLTTPTVTVGSATIALNGTGTTDITFSGVKGTAGVGAYNFSITFDPTKVIVDYVDASNTGVSGGTAPFDAAPTSNAGTGAGKSNTTGTLLFNSFHAMPGPTGDNFKLATIRWKSLAAGQHTLTLTITTLADTDGSNYEGAAVVNGVISTTTVEAGTGTVLVGATSDVPVTVKGVGAPGLKSYDVTIAFDKSKITVASVQDGAAPFGGPATATIDNVAGTVRIADTQTGATPAGNIIVAYLRVQGVAAGTSALTVTINSLKNTADASITATGVNGNVVVSNIAVKSATIALNKGTSEDVSITVENVPAAGLKSYALTVSFDKTKVTVNEVKDGVAPFGAPATKTIDNVAGTVTLADAITTGFPTGNVLVAKLNILGVGVGVSPLTVAVTQLKDGTDADLVYGVSSGTATVSVPTVTVGSATIALNGTGTTDITFSGVKGTAGEGRITSA